MKVSDWTEITAISTTLLRWIWLTKSNNIDNDTVFGKLSLKASEFRKLLF